MSGEDQQLPVADVDGGRWRAVEDRTLCIFSPANPVRRFARWMVAAPWFDHAILLLVLLNSATLSMEAGNKPGYAGSSAAAAIHVMEFIIIAIFTVRQFLPSASEAL
jgi:hypothetical protein